MCTLVLTVMEMWRGPQGLSTPMLLKYFAKKLRTSDIQHYATKQQRTDVRRIHLHILRYNAPAHRSTLAIKYLEEHHVKTLLHPLCDFWINAQLKGSLQCINHKRKDAFEKACFIK